VIALGVIMERMSPLDAGFWQLEDTHASLHIASIAVFEGPAPSYAELTDLVRRKLHLIPRYRQRMRTVPLFLGRPVWVDDPAFDLTYHVRRAAVPSPGDAQQLHRLTGRLMSQHLDRDKPLWEMWLVEGLADGRWALITKIHHSVVDGIAGIGLLATVLDRAPDVDLPEAPDWKAGAQPGVLGLAGAALRERLGAATSAARGAASITIGPVRAARTAGAALRGVAGFAAALRPVAATSLVGPIGTPRRYRWASVDLDDVGVVRRHLGGSVNDVVLAIVARGFRDLLSSRGEPLTPDAVRSLVPVSVRRPADHGHADNRVSALLAELPVEFADPVIAYQAVMARTRKLKASHEAEAGERLTGLADQVPAPLLVATLHAAFRVPQRVLTTVVTNVPGPAQPLYALGRRMLANYPYVPIADRLRVGVAVTSYDGRLFFGVTCDRDSVPDADVLVGGLENGLTELLKAAESIGTNEATGKGRP
jgi:diacylglycerol O-acyltransferase